MIIGIIVVAAVALYILSLPSHIAVDRGSKNAIDNLTHWFSAHLGHRWPYILMTIIGLLIVIFLLATGCNIHVSGDLWAFFSVTTLALAVVLTWRWRQEYLSQHYADLGISKTQYYVEFGLIVLLLVLNVGIVLWTKM